MSRAIWALPDDLTLPFVLANIGATQEMIDQWVAADELKSNNLSLTNYVNDELPSKHQATTKAQLGL